MERELLHAPAAKLSHPQLVVDAAVDRVGDVELLRQLPRPSESAHQLPVQIELVDLSVHVEVEQRVRIGAVEELPRPASDAERRWRPDVQKLRLEVAVAVEHLNAPVALIGDVDVSLRVDRDPVRRVELAWLQP